MGKEGREGERTAANRAYMMNIGHGDSHTESGGCGGGCGSHRISYEMIGWFYPFPVRDTCDESRCAKEPGNTHQRRNLVKRRGIWTGEATEILSFLYRVI